MSYVKSFTKIAEDWTKLVNQSIASSTLSPATKLMGSSAQNAIKVISAVPENTGMGIAKGIGSMVGKAGNLISRVKKF